jgi:hypothetical protein
MSIAGLACEKLANCFDFGETTFSVVQGKICRHLSMDAKIIENAMLSCKFSE